MNPTTAIRLFGAGRIAFGLALATQPARAAATWIGADAARPGTQVMTVAMGARDAAIGAGTLLTAGTPAARGWILAGVASDAADLAATLRTSELPGAARAGVSLLAAGAVAGGLWLLAHDA